MHLDEKLVKHTYSSVGYSICSGHGLEQIISDLKKKKKGTQADLCKKGVRRAQRLGGSIVVSG